MTLYNQKELNRLKYCLINSFLQNRQIDGNHDNKQVDKNYKI